MSSRKCARALDRYQPATWIAAFDEAQDLCLVEHADLRDRYSSLTQREREMLPLLASGLLKKQTAAALGITEYTVQVLRGHIMRKMKADSLPWSSGWWKSSAPAVLERAIRAPVNGGERR